MTASEDSFDDTLRAGIAALRAGDQARAMSLLSRAVRLNPRSEQAWLFLAGAVADPGQRRTCLERALSLNPQSEAARRGLQSLSPAPAPQPPAPAPNTGVTVPLETPLVSLPLEPAIAPRRPTDRLVWALILALGLLLMIGAASYAVMILRG